MALPESYADEGEFAAWMHSVLDQDRMASMLGWTVNNGKYQDAVDEALAVYGEPDITAVTNIHLLHKIGRVELWRSVAERTVMQYAYTAIDDGATHQRQQIHEHALATMKLAMAAIPSKYGAGRLPFGSTTRKFGVDWS